jgi:hypothetical protein
MLDIRHTLKLRLQMTFFTDSAALKGEPPKAGSDMLGRHLRPSSLYPFDRWPFSARYEG